MKFQSLPLSSWSHFFPMTFQIFKLIFNKQFFKFFSNFFEIFLKFFSNFSSNFFQIFFRFFLNFFVFFFWFSKFFYCSLMECAAKKTGWSSAVVLLDFHGTVFGRLKRSDSARWCWSCASIIRLKFLAWFPYGLVRCLTLALISMIIIWIFPFELFKVDHFHRAIWTSPGSPSQIPFLLILLRNFLNVFLFFFLSIFEQNANAKWRVWRLWKMSPSGKCTVAWRPPHVRVVDISNERGG